MKIKASMKIKSAFTIFAILFIGTCLLFFLFLGNGSNQQTVSDSQRVEVSKTPPVISHSLDSAAADHDPAPRVKSHGSVQLEIPSEELKKEKAISAVFSAINGRTPSNGISEEDPDTLINILLDKDAPLRDRRNAAWILAKLGDTDILLQLENILLQQDSPPYLKAAIAEGLGYSSNPMAKNLIFSALENDNDVVVRGAIRGLAAIGDRDSILTLSEILSANNGSNGVIAETAKELAKIDHPDAYDALVSAYNESYDTTTMEFKESIIAALGQRDISETGDFFQNILDETNFSLPLKLATIEALQDAQGDTIPLLLPYLNDEISEVRAETAWTLAYVDEPGDVADSLERRLAVEEDAEVRKRLYQALGNQESVDISAHAEVILQEPNLETRLSGYDLLASHIRTSENKTFQEQFAEEVIPELRKIALSSERIGNKLSAVMALKKASTTESYYALKSIASKSSDPKILDAIGDL
jgi:HEAT repeat protein